MTRLTVWLIAWYHTIRHQIHSLWYPAIQIPARFVERPTRIIPPYLRVKVWECTKCESVKMQSSAFEPCRHPDCWFRFCFTPEWRWSKKPCFACSAEGNYIPPPTTIYMASRGAPINPAFEPDCPECANGVAHEKCRTGWKAHLEANGVKELKLADLAKSSLVWTSPCDTCGGNCGQCGSSHCGICGVKPRDGECDQIKHLAYQIHIRRVET